MKILFNPIKNFIFLSLFLVTVNSSFAQQEFLLHQATVTWTEDINGCGGFYWWYDLGNSPSNNWLTPLNYRSGQFYFRFELKDRPSSSEPIYLGFCIWTDLTDTYKETCSGSLPLNVPGDVATSNSSPESDGWYIGDHGDISWHNMSSMWQIGIPLFNQYGQQVSKGACSLCNCWDEYKDDFLPMTVEITIVVVAQGYTFSGWSNYPSGGGVTPVSPPSYTINYNNERTQQVVVSSDEYSYDQSNWTDGSDNYLDLTPGQTVYFRHKGTSPVQTLNVPSRPSAPEYTINTSTYYTNENISTSTEYSYDQSSWTSGSGSPLELTSDQDVYFRYVATSSAFLSSVQHLVVPTFGVPDYSIDYFQEITNENISSDDEYSTDQTNWTSGSGNKLNLYPGQDVYFRKISDHSKSQHLVVPDRPSTTSYSINYSAVTTNQNIPSTVEYSSGSNMSSPVSGNGSTLGLTPGSNVYFRKKATSGSFASGVQQLDVPSRPTAPSYSIEYSTEMTNEAIPMSVEYSQSSGMSSLTDGSGSTISLTPGTDLYFRVKSTGNSFASVIFTLDVPSRPSAPNYTLNTSTYYTNENISTSTQYSYNQSTWNSGTGSPLELTGGQDVYFRYAATSSAFHSSVQHLVVPALGVPNYSINFFQELTNENISPEDEYSTNQTNWTSGNGSKLNITPGVDVYFRKISDNSKSQHLVVTGRPSKTTYSINYAAETTNQNIPTTVEYSSNSNMSSAVSGNGSALALNAGSDVYFRKKATSGSFASENQHLDVPSRPAKPSYTISYSAETTVEMIPATVEYSQSSAMSSPTSGTGATISVVPGTDLYFRVKSTGSSFASTVYTLDVPSRPSTPAITIDYSNEKTGQVIPATMEYSSNSDMSGSTAGSGVKLDVVPGNDIYFRTSSTASSFRSNVKHLDVPSRPSTPSFSIDYINERTNEVVSNQVKYSTTSTFTSPTTGAGLKINITPGNDLYFIKPATSSSFKSEVQHLEIPTRPIVMSVEPDTTSKNPFQVGIVFPSDVTGFTSGDLIVENGASVNLTNNYFANISPASEGVVTVKVPANCVEGGNFKSNTFSVVFVTDYVGLTEILKKSISIFPNPSDGTFYIKLPNIDLKSTSIEIFDITGQLVNKIESVNDYITEVSGFSKGLYTVRIISSGSTVIKKMVVQ